jgi:hypothetical protein
MAQHDGIAVGRGAGGILHRDGALAAGLVVHEHGLAQALAHLHGQRAGDHVGAAARPVGHDQADRALGLPVLRGMGRSQPGGHHQHGQRRAQTAQGHA